MNLDEFIQSKQEQLTRFEQDLEGRAQHAGDALRAQLETFRTRRDDLVSRLQGLKSETGDRIDVLRMGFESAWDELQTAFKTATARDPNAPTDT